MNRIVDASVVFKAFVPEAGSDAAAALLHEPLIAPDSLVPECLNALRKAVARGRIEQGEALEAARALARADIVLEPTRPLAEDALSLALKLSLTPYDCVYLALARRVGGVVISADGRLVGRCSQPDAVALGLRVESLYARPAVQERAARGYMARRKDKVSSRAPVSSRAKRGIAS
jgi:predicted nucleic acid-binding protein